MHFQDTLADRQPQAGALTGGMGPVRGEEALKNARSVLWQDTHTIVLHGHRAQAIFRPDAECNESAVGRELDRVVDEVHQHLVNAGHIRMYEAGFRIKIAVNVHTMLFQIAGAPQEDPLYEVADVKIGVMGFPERACAEFGAKIEAEFLENAVPALKKAIADAEEARRSGKRIVHDNGGKMKIRNV